MNSPGVSISYSADSIITRYFHPKNDTLIIQQLDYEYLNFRPGVVQEMSGMRMRLEMLRG